MTTKSKVPQIRFKGFSGEWEENIINNLGDIVTGSTPKTQDKSNYCGEYLFVSPADIQNNRYVESTITTLSLKGHNLGRILEKNSVLFVSIGSTIGKVAQIKNKATTNQQINAINPNKYNDSNFIYSMLVNKSERIKKLASAQAVPIINKTSFSEIEILIPHIAEQIKIGNYFQQLDKLLEQKEKKYQKLKQFKKAMLDKMFPKNGADTPEIRFKGFSGKWEEGILGEVTDVYDGTHQTPNYTVSGVMFLSVENIKTLYSEKYISEEAFEKEFKIFPKKNDVLMTRIGDIGTANVVETDTPKAYYVSLALLKYKGLNPYFLKTSIFSETVKKDLWHRTLHIAFPKKINKNEIAKIKVYYPASENEQEKIGNYFQKLDTQIDLQQKELEKLKNIKKASLSKMFV